MADKSGSKLPIFGGIKKTDSLGVTVLRILGLGIAGGAALIVMADTAGKKIEARRAAENSKNNAEE